MGILETIYTSAPGKRLAATAGLKEPPRLTRGPQWLPGPIVLAEPEDGHLAREVLAAAGLTWMDPVVDAQADVPPGYSDRIGAIVIDATGIGHIDHLEQVRAVLRPAVRAMAPSGRLILLARSPQSGWSEQATTQALDGIMRTVGKELRGGATANLVLADYDVVASDLESTFRFLLQGRSAFVSGQTWRIHHAETPSANDAAALTGKLVIVTGAARGIGAAMARTLARDGAHIVAVDIPAAGQALASVANEISGWAVQVDITAPDAGGRLAAAVTSTGMDLYGIVHNAGITRDRSVVNLDASRWHQVLDVNLKAQISINEVLLDPDTPGGLTAGGRIVGVASTTALAGNKGQTNYAASKAGVVGLVRAMAPDLAPRSITVNAVAPGFIETEMTGRIPFVQREVFRRTNSLSQGGQPVDVAEAVGYLLDPASAGVTGQVLRVCGQNLVGA